MIGTEIVGGVTTLNKNAKEALGFNSETGKYSRRRELVALRCGFYNELISREFSGASEKGWKKMIGQHILSYILNKIANYI